MRAPRLAPANAGAPFARPVVRTGRIMRAEPCWCFCPICPEKARSRESDDGREHGEVPVSPRACQSAPCTRQTAARQPRCASRRVLARRHPRTRGRDTVPPRPALRNPTQSPVANAGITPSYPQRPPTPSQRCRAPALLWFPGDELANLRKPHPALARSTTNHSRGENNDAL